MPYPNDVLHIHETLHGYGDAFYGDQRIAVRYVLKDVEENKQMLDSINSNALPARAVYGLLYTTQALALGALIGSTLALQLESGKILQFAVVKDLGHNSVLVQGLNNPSSRNDAQAGSRNSVRHHD
jgi:hypothetical protein